MMDDKPVFFYCDKCRGLYRESNLGGHSRKLCDETVVNSNAAFFAVDACIARTLPTLGKADVCMPPIEGTVTRKSNRRKVPSDSNISQKEESLPQKKSANVADTDNSPVRKSRRIASKTRRATVTRTGLVFKEVPQEITPKVEPEEKVEPPDEPMEDISEPIPVPSLDKSEVLDHDDMKVDSIDVNSGQMKSSELDDPVANFLSPSSEDSSGEHVDHGQTGQQEYDAVEMQASTESKDLGLLQTVENTASKIEPLVISPDDSVDISEAAHLIKDEEKPQEKTLSTSKKADRTRSSVTPAKKNAVSSKEWKDHVAQMREKYKEFVAETVNVVSGGKKKPTMSDRVRYQCPHCPFKSIQIGHFDRHMTGIHGGKGQYICEFCGYETSRKGNLTKHRKSHLKPYVCDVCAERFTCGKDLKRHTWKHTGELPYQCGQCDYKSRFRERLNIHMRVHTGERIACGIGDCTFTSQYETSVSTHQKTVHGLGSVLSCDCCNYQTANPTSLYIHKKRHSGVKKFACSMCEFTALTKQAVERHLVKHTKEKTYQCDRCDFSSGHHTAFRTHMMNHMGVRPYQCSLCSYSSITKQKVIRHITTKDQCNGANIIDLGIKLDMDISKFRKKSEDPAPEGDGTDLVFAVADNKDDDCELQDIMHVYQCEEVTETIVAVDGLENKPESGPEGKLAEPVTQQLALQDYCQVHIEEDGSKIVYLQQEEGALGPEVGDVGLPLSTGDGEVIYYTMNNSEAEQLSENAVV